MVRNGFGATVLLKNVGPVEDFFGAVRVALLKFLLRYGCGAGFSQIILAWYVCGWGSLRFFLVRCGNGTVPFRNLRWYGNTN